MPFSEFTFSQILRYVYSVGKFRKGYNIHTKPVRTNDFNFFLPSLFGSLNSFISGSTGPI